MKRPGFLFLLLIISHSIFSQAIFPQRDSLTHLFGYKSGYKNAKWIIKPSFDFAEEFNNNLAIIRTKQGYGLINNKGVFIINPQFEELSGDKYFIFKKNNERGIINAKGKILISGEYDHIYFEPLTGNAILSKDRLYGYWDTTGNFIAPLSKYELAFNNELAYFNSGKSQGFINKKGEKIIEVEQGDVWDIIPYGFLSKKGKKDCLFDMSGKPIGQCDFDSVIQLRKYFILFYKDGKYGIINYKGESLLPESYDYISPFNEQGISVVKKGELYGLINEKFEMVMPFDNQKIEQFGNGYNRFYGKYKSYYKFSIYKKNDHFGVVNDSGRVIIEPQYDMAMIEGKHLLKFVYKDMLGLHDLRKLEKLPLTTTYDFINDKTIFCINNDGIKCGVARKDGKIIVMPGYTSISPTVNGYAIVRNKSGAGIIDSTGKSMTPLVYADIKTLDDIYKTYFHHTGDFVWDGFLYLKTKNDKVGVATEDGKLVIDTSYTNVSAFDTECNCWFVQTAKGTWNIISLPGKKYAAALDTPSIYISPGIAVAKKKDLYGIINSEGKTIFPFKHKKIIPQSNMLFYYMTDSLWGIVNNKGQVITKPVYKNITLFNGVSFAKTTDWGIIDSSGKFTVGYDLLAKFRKGKIDASADSLNIAEFSFNNDFNEYDVVSFNVLMNHSNKILLKKANDMILDQIKNILENNYSSTETIMFPKNKQGLSTDLYIGRGTEIVNVTEKTITLNNFTEKSANEIASLDENYDVFFISDSSLKKILIKDILKNESDTSRLRALIHTKLKEWDREKYAKFNLDADLNFQISKDGIIFRLSDLIEKNSEASREAVITLSYSEIEFFVKKDGALREFY